MDVDIVNFSCYPNDHSGRDPFRRYKNQSSISPQHVSVSKISESGFVYDGESIERRPNATLLLNNIKSEVGAFDAEYLDGALEKLLSPVSQRSPSYNDVDIDAQFAYHSFNRGRSYSLQSCKFEEDELTDDGESTIALFASLWDHGLQGLMPFPDLILHLENCCRGVSEAIRYGDNERHRVVQDQLMRQKTRVLLDEAASWSLLWYLYGKGSEEIPADMVLTPPTSHLEACQFVLNDHTAQLCVRIVQWTEGLASKALDLDNKVRGSHIGSHIASSGVWHHTQRFLKNGLSNQNTVHHLDFDAPTREHVQQLPDDKKQDDALLEDVWTLLRAGRLEEACNLCRAAGQAWRAATLLPFGGLEQFPSIEALVKNGKNRTLQAIELESGIAHQYRLWKWASYCASEKIAEQGGGKYEAAVYAVQCSNLKRMLPICTDWETACWALAKSWLDVQVDLEIGQIHPGKSDDFKNYDDDSVDKRLALVEKCSQSLAGPEYWPFQVQGQQPQNIASLLQKLHSNDTVLEVVTRGCKEQHRQIQINLMIGDISHLLDLIWSWISPSEDGNLSWSRVDSQMMRFGAHLVLLLRQLLADHVSDPFNEKLITVGDRIIHIYAMFLFSNQHEELVGLYASQLARPHCIDLFVHMMELSLQESVDMKYKIFLSAIKYLPFSPLVDSKGSFEEIMDRVLSCSREIKPVKYDNLSDIMEQHRLHSLHKAMVVQWLCFTPPSTIDDFNIVSTKLLAWALMHSNILLREFALISMWRAPKLPSGAQMLFGFLSEPLKQHKDSESLPSTEDIEFAENLKEFQNWSEFYAIDSTYRMWLKLELDNAKEKQSAIAAAEDTLNASMHLLERKNPWLVTNEDYLYFEPAFLELRATAMLCLPLGECICPDATLCATLLSAFYSSISEEVVSGRELTKVMGQRYQRCIMDILHYLNINCPTSKLQETPTIPLFRISFRTGFRSGYDTEMPLFLCFSCFRGMFCIISISETLYRFHGSVHPSPKINVSISTNDASCIEVVLRCLPAVGDGLGPHEFDDGGILAAVITAGFKGDLTRFQAGVTMDISRIDAWYSNMNGSLKVPAKYILLGLCRRCCLPEIILRCMQVSVSLVHAGEPPSCHEKLIDLVASREAGFLNLFSQHQLEVSVSLVHAGEPPSCHEKMIDLVASREAEFLNLFSQHQLEEFLLLEREYQISKIELQHELS